MDQLIVAGKPDRLSGTSASSCLFPFARGLCPASRAEDGWGFASPGHKVPAAQGKGPAPQAQLRQVVIIVSEQFCCIPGKNHLFFLTWFLKSGSSNQVQTAIGSCIKWEGFLAISRLLGKMSGNSTFLSPTGVCLLGGLELSQSSRRSSKIVKTTALLKMPSEWWHCA